MKKVLVALLAGALFVPAFAGDKNDGKQPDRKKNVVAAQSHMKKGEFEQARKEHMEKLKATKEKADKLVKEYNKAKGAKKEAKKAEIESFVKSIHEEQLKFKEEQLGKFAKRLEDMKNSLAEEKATSNEWVSQKTEAFIAQEGDLKVLFDRPEGHFPGMDNKKPHMNGPKGKHPGHKFMGPRAKGPRPDFEGEEPEDMMQEPAPAN